MPICGQLLYVKLPKIKEAGNYDKEYFIDYQRPRKNMRNNTSLNTFLGTSLEVYFVKKESLKIQRFDFK